MRRPWIELRSPGLLANTLPTRLMSRFWFDVKSKVGDRTRGWPESSLFNSYCTKVYWITPLYPWSLPYNVKQGSIKYHVFRMTRPGIEPRSPGSLANTLTIMPIALYFVKLLWTFNKSNFPRQSESFSTPFEYFLLKDFKEMCGSFSKILYLFMWVSKIIPLFFSVYNFRLL